MYYIGILNEFCGADWFDDGRYAPQGKRWLAPLSATELISALHLAVGP